MELSFARVGVTLGRRTVLREIEATLRPGRITAILGPNGAGKSSLIKAAAALVPVAGLVRIGDRDVAALDPRVRARWIGYLPQDAALHWNVTVKDLIALGRVPHRSPFAAPSPADGVAIVGAMEATGTASLADRPVHELSGGERARVLLARVLAGEPRWLLADEPLASLDPAHQIDILHRLQELAWTGSGVAIVLHDLLLAGRYADDVLLLKDGALVAAGATRDVLTPDLLRAVFDIEVAVSRDQSDRPVCVTLGRAAG